MSYSLRFFYSCTKLGPALALARVLGCSSSVTATVHLSAVKDVADRVTELMVDHDWLSVDESWSRVNAEIISALLGVVKRHMPSATDVIVLLQCGDYQGMAVAVNFVLLTVIRAMDVMAAMEAEQAAVQEQGGRHALPTEAGSLVVPAPSAEVRAYLKNPVRSGNLCAYEAVAAYSDVGKEDSARDYTDCSKLFDTPARKGGRCG